jgi:hypothetical protein
LKPSVLDDQSLNFRSRMRINLFIHRVQDWRPRRRLPNQIATPPEAIDEPRPYHL